MGVPTGFQGEQWRSSIRDGCVTQPGIIPWRESKQGSVSEILFTTLYTWLNYDYFLAGKFEKKYLGLNTPFHFSPNRVSNPLRAEPHSCCR